MNTNNELTLQSLFEMNMSFMPACVLKTAVQMSVFTHIARGKTKVPEVASAADASERGIGILLDALVALDLLEKSGGEYRLVPLSQRYLVQGADEYIGGMIGNTALLENWTRLPEVVRTGKPVTPVETRERAEDFFPYLVQGLHVSNREPARKAANSLAEKRAGHEIRHVLDVGAGSAIWGIAMAERFPQARVTAHDFPGVLPTTRDYVRRHGLEDRFEFLGGDLKEVDFGSEQFDVAILGNIVHSEGPESSCDLFRRLNRALQPGGSLVIIDMIPNEDRTDPPYPLLFAVNMLVHTEEGGTYTLTEYNEWLREAGFSEAETVDIESHSPMLLARKPSF